MGFITTTHVLQLPSSGMLRLTSRIFQGSLLAALALCNLTPPLKAISTRASCPPKRLKGSRRLTKTPAALWQPSLQTLNPRPFQCENVKPKKGSLSPIIPHHPFKKKTSSPTPEALKAPYGLVIGVSQASVQQTWG